MNPSVNNPLDFVPNFVWFCKHPIQFYAMKIISIRYDEIKFRWGFLPWLDFGAVIFTFVGEEEEEERRWFFTDKLERVFRPTYLVTMTVLFLYDE